MMDLFLWVALLGLLVWNNIEIRRMKTTVTRLEKALNIIIRKTSSHQSNAGVKLTPPGTPPKREKAYALPRDDLPRTGRQKRGLTFEMAGGEDGSDSPVNRLPERGRRPGSAFRQVGGTELD